MPYLKIQTNHAIEPGQVKTLLAAASKTIAAELGKPERYVMVELTTNPAFLFAGTDELAAYVELKSIGLPTVQTKDLSKAICSLLESQAGVPAERIYIEFADAKGSLWGWNSSTF
jgi:phenylpyruvate tautomerase